MYWTGIKHSENSWFADLEIGIFQLRLGKFGAIAAEQSQ